MRRIPQFAVKPKQRNGKKNVETDAAIGGEDPSIQSPFFKGTAATVVGHPIRQSDQRSLINPSTCDARWCQGWQPEG